MHRLLFLLTLLLSATALALDVDETIKGTAQADQLSGDANNEQLLGGDGDDNLSGGGGDDLLIGGNGDDVIRGGSGADFMVFRLSDEGIDEVLDFSPEEGDTVIIDFSSQPSLLTTTGKTNQLRIPRKISYANIEVNRRGDIKVKLANNSWKSVVRLKRSDLDFSLSQKGNKAYLRFSQKFE